MCKCFFVDMTWKVNQCALFFTNTTTMKTLKHALFVVLLIFVLLHISLAKKQKKKIAVLATCSCDIVYSPVCDVSSGTTYPNYCLAQCLKAKKIQHGECPKMRQLSFQNVCNHTQVKGPKACGMEFLLSAKRKDGGYSTACKRVSHVKAHVLEH